MLTIKNSGLDQYGAEPFEQQQFGTAGVERVKSRFYRPRMRRGDAFDRISLSVCTNLVV